MPDTKTQVLLMDIRKILLVILWHTLDSNASDTYIKEQLYLAGATPAEVKRIQGED